LDGDRPKAASAEVSSVKPFSKLYCLNLNQLLSKSDVKDAFNDEDTKKEPDCKLSEIEVVETPGKIPLFIDLKSDEIKKLFYELVFRC
jgi:hypothetical protein